MATICRNMSGYNFERINNKNPLLHREFVGLFTYDVRYFCLSVQLHRYIWLRCVSRPATVCQYANYGVSVRQLRCVCTTATVCLYVSYGVSLRQLRRVLRQLRCVFTTATVCLYASYGVSVRQLLVCLYDSYGVSVRQLWCVCTTATVCLYVSSFLFC
jgi:hypothetical protein